MTRFKGVVPGIVKDLKDPDGMGRLRVEFPRMPGSRSFWASVAAPMAGKHRGFFYQPELEDEVLVAFDEGDPQHPYIVGFLWNGQDLPPESNPQNRVIVTPGGHTLRFEDGAGARKIVIRSSGGLTITLDDAGQGSIELHGGGRLLSMRGNQVQIS
jgi:uncharacterized protein involved in type VI secretion and phage assembly